LGPQAGYTVAIKVVNGALQSPPQIYGNDCMLPGGLYYNVAVLDNNGNTYFTDKWQITGSTIDIGTIVSVVISGTTQTLGSTGFVQLVPSVTQIINQPVGTYLGTTYLAVTGIITFPDGSQCTTAGCVLYTTGNAVLLTGNQTAAGIKTFTDGLVSSVFNCTSAGATNCFQQYLGTFSITGAGDAAFQTVTATTGSVARTFNSRAAGDTNAFEQYLGTFSITGAGDAAFQSVALTNGITTGRGAYGLNGSGVLTAAGLQIPSFIWTPSTGVLDVCASLVGTCTVNSGVAAQAFSSTATGTQTAFTDSVGNFSINGNGQGAFQTLVVTSTFNSEATGTTAAFQQYLGTFVITGAGNASFQSVSTASNIVTISGVFGVGASTGVSCSGTPSSSFASVGGIVTHC
jgi:hypothetical protein